jgi:PUA domain protein
MFRHHNEAWCPTLRLLHQYPFLLPQQRVDKGAIRFVLSGANIMCPGLTHPNAKMTAVDEGTVVGIFAEGKTNALAVGKTSMSTKEITEKNKGVGVENYHYLNDGLWQMKTFK